MAQKRGLPEPQRVVRRERRPVGRSSAAASVPPWWHRWVLWAAMLATLPLVNPHIRSDGNTYYAYVRSLVIDHDLHFDNEYEHAEPSFAKAMEGELRLLPTGYRRNHTAVGAAVLWSPFFLAAHAGISLARGRGYDVAADGWSWPYVWACAGATAVFAFLGLWWAYLMACRWARPAAALVAVVAVWLATSLPVYLYFLPFHAHALAAFTVSWFLWNWFKIRDGAASRGRWIVWGLSAGLMAITYYVNGLIIVVAAIECVSRAVKPRQFVATAAGALWFGLGFVAAALPHVVIKRVIEGGFFATGYAPGLFFWNDPRLAAVAFSSEHGVLLWTPVVALAAIGLLIALRRQPAAGAPLLAAAAVMYYAVAAYRNWHGHSSYGNRFLTALTPIFVIGLAALVDAFVGAGSRRRWAAAWAAAAVFALWNAGLMFQWGDNIIPNRGPVDMRQAAVNQFTVVPAQAMSFLRRYFVDRSGTVSDVEKQDAAEIPKFTIKR